VRGTVAALRSTSNCAALTGVGVCRTGGDGGVNSLNDVLVIHLSHALLGYNRTMRTISVLKTVVPHFVCFSPDVRSNWPQIAHIVK
jgi:hypothetical protein